MNLMTGVALPYEACFTPVISVNVLLAPGRKGARVQGDKCYNFVSSVTVLQIVCRLLLTVMVKRMVILSDPGVTD